jgi:ADP-heptose:LPS heptosyltransferase
VLEVNEQNAVEVMRAEELPAAVFTWDGGIGAFAGLIAASDEYIGYDSAGQHIAAALGVPTLTVFVNANAPVFAERWRPSGSGIIEVVEVEAAQLAQVEAASASILARTLAAREDVRLRLSR